MQQMVCVGCKKDRTNDRTKKRTNRRAARRCLPADSLRSKLKTRIESELKYKLLIVGALEGKGQLNGEALVCQLHNMCRYNAWRIDRIGAYLSSKV